MALQELNPTIQHCSGKHNMNADALSRCLLPSSALTTELVAAFTTAEEGEDARSTDRDSLSVLQRSDPEL
jgi:hypothetical protein